MRPASSVPGTVPGTDGQRHAQLARGDRERERGIAGAHGDSGVGTPVFELPLDVHESLGEAIRGVNPGLQAGFAQGRLERFRSGFLAREYHVLARHRLKRTQFAADIGEQELFAVIPG